MESVIKIAIYILILISIWGLIDGGK